MGQLLDNRARQIGIARPAAREERLQFALQTDDRLGLPRQGYELLLNHRAKGCAGGLSVLQLALQRLDFLQAEPELLGEPQVAKHGQRPVVVMPGALGLSRLLNQSAALVETDRLHADARFLGQPADRSPRTHDESLRSGL